jgi:hypothetical protein
MTTLLVATVVTAQTSFGIFGGPQSTSARYTIDGTVQKTNYKYGYQGGIFWDITLEGNIHFAPQLFYSLKGYKVTYNKPAYPPDVTATDNNVRLHTFEILPMFQFNFSKKPDHFFIKMGPSMDIQLYGNEKFHLLNGNMVSRSMRFGNADYGRFGANLVGHLGYEIRSGYIFFVHYSYGIGSINNADDGPRIWHRVLGFSIGKYFIRKKIR